MAPLCRQRHLEVMIKWCRCCWTKELMSAWYLIRFQHQILLRVLENQYVMIPHGKRCLMQLWMPTTGSLVCGEA